MEGDKMIIYENENARLLIEGGEKNLESIIAKKYKESDTIYLTERAAFLIYDTFVNKKIHNIEITVNDKRVFLIPVCCMKMA